MSRTNRIEGFEGEYRFLSNFFIEPDGSHVEGEFQRAKCGDVREDHLFDNLTPAAAKKLGKQVYLRPDWEDVKTRVMYQLVRQKFLDHPTLAERLLFTGSAFLEETNWWGDTYWGAVKSKGKSAGANMLGHILMFVREELRRVAR